MTLSFVNGQVLTEDGFSADAIVVVAHGRIVEVRSGAVPAAGEIVDLEGRYLVPGFIDVQVNGGGDVLFNTAPTLAGVRRIAQAHRGFGTTGMLPTLISDDAAVMHQAIAAVRDAIAQGVPGVLGIHLEGPYLAAARKGVHDQGKFRLPDASEIELVASLGVGKTLLTLAPERFSAEVLRALSARGVILSAGHTSANYQQLRAGFAAGVRGVTHLFNAMTAMTSREPGAVGAALDDPHSWCGVIADGHHVHEASLRIAIAAKPRGKVFLVTDAMPPLGGAKADFDLYGDTISCRDGRCTRADGTLAGSALDMASAVRHCVRRLGVPLAEACRMAATYPAEFLGLGHERGRIAAGCRADLVVLDEQIIAAETWIGGERSRRLQPKRNEVRD
ncbi:MAG: N-acetylglucosamine-6-phosphate deacetylase [Luteimonas sp.]